MSQPCKLRTIIRSEQLNLNLQNVLNNLLMMDFNYPVCQRDELPCVIRSSRNVIGKEQNLIKSLGTAQSLINTLKFLKLKQKKSKPITSQQSKDTNISSFIFLRPLKAAQKDQKQFFLLQNKHQQKLNLDNPKSVLILPQNSLITIQRKYINLYQIQDDLKLSLKDFDSNGLGKKFTFTQMKHVSYKGREYVIIFGNQKYQFNALFLGLVYQVYAGRLRYLKRALLCDKEVVSPTVVFQEDPSSKDGEKICVVLGGCCDNFQTIHYSALKINLHILLSDFLSYSLANTCTIPFNKKISLLSGKAICYKQAWYCFCSQQQTINQIIFQYGGGKQLTMINIETEKLNFKDKVYFGENSLYYLYEGDEDKIVFVDKNMEVRFRALDDLVYKFKR